MSKTLFNTIFILITALILGGVGYYFYTQSEKAPTYDQTNLAIGKNLKSKTVKWCLGCKTETGNTNREVRAIFSVEADVKSISAFVSGGSDNTADKCVVASILSPSGAVMKTEKMCASSKKWDKLTVNVTSAGNYKLAILDDDTSLTGEQPGNGGSYRVELKK